MCIIVRYAMIMNGSLLGKYIRAIQLLQLATFDYRPGTSYLNCDNVQNLVGKYVSV